MQANHHATIAALAASPADPAFPPVAAAPQASRTVPASSFVPSDLMTAGCTENAYALRVKGDSMHPAIRCGAFVVVEPNGRCVPGEYVAIALLDDRKMVKELVAERADAVVVESVNGAQRQTIERKLIRQMHPVTAVVAASKWRPA